MADDPQYSAKAIAFELKEDIDPNGNYDVKELDEKVYSCLSEVDSLLMNLRLDGYSDFEMEHVRLLIDGMRHAHKSIRKLLVGDQSASSVDALTIARLQVENVFSTAFMVDGCANVRLYVKNAWKSKYVRFLLQRIECEKLPRFTEYFRSDGINTLNALQSKSFVTDEERKVIEAQQLGIKQEEGWKKYKIAPFPAPHTVLQECSDSDLKRMLTRLYAEYEYLCSFAHGVNDSPLFRTMSDPRSPYRHYSSSSQIEDFYQRQILETPVLYSAMSCVIVGTEVAAKFPDAIELKAKLTGAWTLLINIGLQAQFAWHLRAKKILGVLDAS